MDHIIINLDWQCEERNGPKVAHSAHPYCTETDTRENTCVHVRPSIRSPCTSSIARAIAASVSRCRCICALRDGGLVGGIL